MLRDYLGAWYGLPVIYHADYNGLAPRRVMLLKRTVEALPWERRLPLLSAAAVRLILTDESLGLPGVERLATVDNRSGRPFYLYRNRRAADRVGFVTVCLGVSSPEEAMGALLAPGFDPRQHAVVEGLAPAAGRRSVCPRDPEVRVVAATRERRTVEIATECAGALVLAETHYPGWRARVDGRPAPLLRANVAFQAVWLEPGRHTVELRYAPKSLALGLAVSALTALGLLVGALIRPARPPARRGRSAGGAGATG